MIKVHMLPAGLGDFLWIRFGKGDKLDNNIVIDGGHDKFSGMYTQVLQSIAAKDQTAMIIMTHIDSDHIQAAAQALCDLPEELLSRVVDKIYFNTGRSIRKTQPPLVASGPAARNPEDEITVSERGFTHSVKDGEKFLSMIERKGLGERLVELTVYPAEKEYKGARLRFVSPGQKEVDKLVQKWEKYNASRRNPRHAAVVPSTTNLDDLKNERLLQDTSVTNKSSLAFIFEYDGRKGVFLGDAAAPVVCAGLRSLGIKKPYPVDFVKISHHGSMRNISDKLLKAIPSQNYLISTEGNPDANVPNKITIAHMLKVSGAITIYNNYPWWAGNGTYHNAYFTEDDLAAYIDTGILKLVELTEKTVQVDEGLAFCGVYTGLE